MKTLIAWDCGNGDMKVASNVVSQPISFPAVIGQLEGYERVDLGYNGEKMDNMTIALNDKEYAVGKMALKNSTIRSHDSTDEKYTSKETMLLARTAFSLVSPPDQSTIANVVIGLPLARMSKAQEIAQHYKGTSTGFKLGFFGEYRASHALVIEKVAVAPQHFGTMFDLILDDRGEISNRELAKRGLAIFDIGYKTNDGSVFKNFEPIGRFNLHSKNGMHVAFSHIKNAINREFGGLEIKEYEVPEVIRTGSVKGTSIVTIINDAFYALASNVVSEIKTKWENAWEIEQYVFTGGGAMLLQPYLAQAFEALFKDQTSNVSGLRKYAIRMWGRDAS